jgi:Velvet factor
VAYSDLIGLDGKRGKYFVFSDLSVRLTGTYSLLFKLVDAGDSGDEIKVRSENGKVLAQIYSAPFTVYETKDYQILG